MPCTVQYKNILYVRSKLPISSARRLFIYFFFAHTVRYAQIPESPWTCLRGHEDTLRDVVQHLQEELRVGTGLGRRFDLVRVQFTGLARLKDPERKIVCHDALRANQ